MHENSKAESLSVLLDRVKAELDSLTTIVGDLQTSLGPILMESVARDPVAYHYAQSIDFVWQTLDSLAKVVDRAANTDVSLQTVDVDRIVGTLPLAGLATRLRGHPEHDDKSDDVDLF